MYAPNGQQEAPSPAWFALGLLSVPLSISVALALNALLWYFYDGYAADNGFGGLPGVFAVATSLAVWAVALKAPGTLARSAFGSADARFRAGRLLSMLGAAALLIPYMFAWGGFGHLSGAFVRGTQALGLPAWLRPDRPENASPLGLGPALDVVQANGLGTAVVGGLALLLVLIAFRGSTYTVPRRRYDYRTYGDRYDGRYDD